MAFVFRKGLVLPDRLRSRLGRVFGKVIQTKGLASNVRKGDRIFAVGDIVVRTLLRNGYSPSVAVFDYRTARGRISVPAIARRYKRPARAINKPGEISAELWGAVRKASRSKRPVGIRVYGEEDLASLVCIHFAPVGSVVMYGIRGRGINIIRVDRRIKEFADRVLAEMRRESPRRPASRSFVMPLSQNRAL